jgi:hypothetical protein
MVFQTGVECIEDEDDNDMRVGVNVRIGNQVKRRRIEY